MTKLQPAVSGDVDRRIVQLNGVTDLTTVASVRATVQHSTTDEVAVLTATVTNAAADAREVTIELGSWLSDGPTLGQWYFQIETTWADGTIITHPTPAVPDTILVAADHD